MWCEGLASPCNRKANAGVYRTGYIYPVRRLPHATATPCRMRMTMRHHRTLAQHARPRARSGGSRAAVVASKDESLFPSLAQDMFQGRSGRARAPSSAVPCIRASRARPPGRRAPPAGSGTRSRTRGSRARPLTAGPTSTPSSGMIGPAAVAPLSALFPHYRPRRCTARPSPRTAVAATTKGPRGARAPRGRRAATPLSRPRHARPHVASISSKLAGRAHHPTSSR